MKQMSCVFQHHLEHEIIKWKMTTSKYLLKEALGLALLGDDGGVLFKRLLFMPFA